MKGACERESSRILNVSDTLWRWYVQCMLWHKENFFLKSFLYLFFASLGMLLLIVLLLHPYLAFGGDVMFVCSV